MTSISSADGTRLTSKLSILIASPFTTFQNSPLVTSSRVSIQLEKKVQKFPRYDKLILHFHVFFVSLFSDRVFRHSQPLLFRFHAPAWAPLVAKLFLFFFLLLYHIRPGVGTLAGTRNTTKKPQKVRRLGGNALMNVLFGGCSYSFRREWWNGVCNCTRVSWSVI